jgi:hypothetical protein
VAAVLIMVPLAVAFAGPLKSVLSRPDNPHGKFRGECSECHSAKAWKPARISSKFDHAKSGFPLEGAHAAVDCKSCHASLDFTQEKQLCVSCHEDVHNGELGSECARCHTSRSFVDRVVMLRAHQLSRFPLTGSHASLECEDCHQPTAAGQMQFVGKRADCYGCHIADYQAAKVPDHTAAGFSTDCMTCHTTTRWLGARFNHDLTAFPLRGAHRSVACATCHGDNVFRGKNTACVSCHLNDYNATTNPPHASVGFSTQCESCHTPAGWAASATFLNHDAAFFPIYSGVHRALWTNCNTCHINPPNFAQFSCFSCHPHSDQTLTNQTHAAVLGYDYDNQSCYACHPRGIR